MTQRKIRFGFLVMACLTVACGNSHSVSDGGVDASTDASRDAGEVCGATTCASGDLCCSDCSGNRFCSIACPGVPCPVGCGGLGGVECDAAEYCDYITAGSVSCGADDGTGVCARRPTACDAIYDPVCGCDGVDYPSACEARAAGQDVAGFGMCGAAVVDCRLTGCSAGERCIVCGPPGTGFSCVMDGVVCGL